MKHYTVDIPVKMTKIKAFLDTAVAGGADVEEVVRSLEELVEIVENLDFASDYNRIGGLPALMALLKVRKGEAHVLGPQLGAAGSLTGQGNAECVHRVLAEPARVGPRRGGGGDCDERAEPRQGARRDARCRGHGGSGVAFRGRRSRCGGQGAVGGGQPRARQRRGRGGIQGRPGAH